jgi:hypothetical protein
LIGCPGPAVVLGAILGAEAQPERGVTTRIGAHPVGEGMMTIMAASAGGPGDQPASPSDFPSDPAVRTLFAPRVRYASVNDSEFDPCMDWRAEMWLGHLDLAGEPDVRGGYADFLTIRLGEHPIAEMLDALSQDAENFAALFDGSDVAASVREQFPEPVNTVLILLTVFIATPLRGHHLGAWLAAEVIARMGSPSDTLVVLYPHPAGPTPDDISPLQAIDTLNRYWRTTGLVPIEEHPAFFGQSSAYTALPAARSAVGYVADVQIPVDTTDIGVDLL